MATITAVPAGGNWGDTTTWDTASVPTAADDVVLAASSGNVTIAAAAVARSLNCTGYTGTLTHNAGLNLTLGDATAGAGNAVLTLSAGMTYTLGDPLTSAIVLSSTSATQQSITTAGKTLGGVTINGAGASWIFNDAITSNGIISITAGALSTNNQTVTCNAFQMNGGTVNVACGSSTFNLTGTAAGQNLFLRTGGATFTMGAAIINIVTASANSRQFAPLSTALTQATLNYTLNGSTGALTIPAPLDIGSINFSDTSNARSLIFTAGSTYTIRNTFSVQGSPAGNMSVISSVGGSVATLSKPSRVADCNYLTLQDITATGGASWYAGANSTIVSNVTGWMLTPPSHYQFLQFNDI